MTVQDDAITPDLIPSQVPTHWYNLAAELDEPIPPHLHPGTKEPVGPDDLAALFPAGLIAQEVSPDPYIEIPEPVREIYKMWRPSPLIRARRFEGSLNTKARIYVKYEGVSPVGSHKTNSAVAQAYYNSIDGVKRLTTETGAGQWGSALAFAGAQFGIDIEVWQVRASYDSKPYRGFLIRTYGGTLHPSPSDLTESGRAMLAKDPNTTGSLGMAVSEAVEVAAQNPDTRYALGSVLNHVVLHQSVIGQEAVVQLAQVEAGADVVFGCAGGGSNLAGLSFPFLREKLHGRGNAKIVAAEPSACPSITEGEYRYDHGDVAGLTPLLKMHTLGMDFVPDPIHAGGLRYHGDSPIVSALVKAGRMEAVACPQSKVFEAATLFARTEGKLPAPETGHAIRAAIDEALAAKETGEEKVILFNYSGHGFLDLSAYDAYNQGNLIDE